MNRLTGRGVLDMAEEPVESCDGWNLRLHYQGRQDKVFYSKLMDPKLEG